MPRSDTVVVKIGSQSLVDAKGALNRRLLAAVARQLAAVAAQGWRPVLVTSGAVACGLNRMGLVQRPSAISQVQALAAIGQADLAHRWQEALADQGLVAAQVLLTQDAFNNRRRYLNLTATFRALFEHGAVPVVNENDTVAVEELTVGDNDRLSALVASQLGARLLVLLTDIDGCYDGDPRDSSAARLIPRIDRITPTVLAAAGGGGALGRGGMRSKLEAAALASRAGVETVIALARAPRVIERAVADEAIGTRIIARGGIVPSGRRRWLALARSGKGVLEVDDGAAQALLHRGRSLLLAGISAVHGSFQRGDTVDIRDRQGHRLARGMVGLGADELRQVIGQRSDQAARNLGYPLPKAAVHRDHLLVL